MGNYSNLEPKVALEKYRIKRGFIGVFLALAAGATWPFVGNLMTYAGGFPPYDGYYTTLWLMTITGLIIAAVHDTFAAIWLLIYNCITHRGKEYIRALRTRSAKICILAGLWGGPIATGCYSVALVFAPAPYVLAINALFPVFGTIFGVLFLKEKLSSRAWFGIIIVVAGAILVGWAPPEGGSYPYFYIGIALAVLSAIGLAADCATGTYGMDLLDPEIASGIKLFSAGISNGVIFCTIISVLTSNGLINLRIFGEGLTTFPYAFILIIAAIFGATTWVVNYRSMNIIGAGRGMAINASFAVFGIPITGLFYLLGLASFSITVTAVIGALVLFAGVVIVVIHPKELLINRKHQLNE